MSTHPRHLFHSSPPAASHTPPLGGSEEKNAVTETKHTRHLTCELDQDMDFLIAIPRVVCGENMRRSSTGSDWEGLRLGKYVDVTENRVFTPQIIHFNQGFP